MVAHMANVNINNIRYCVYWDAKEPNWFEKLKFHKGRSVKSFALLAEAKKFAEWQESWNERFPDKDVENTIAIDFKSCVELLNK